MTRISRVGLALGVALLCLNACQPADQPGGTGQSAGQAKGAAEVSKVDVRFINAAGPAGLAELGFGQLAATKAANPAVRRLAEAIVADFTTLNQQLADLAKVLGMSLASDMDGRNQILLHQLQALNGPNFDHAYINSQLQNLTMAIQAFQAETDSGSNSQVQGIAKKYLPIMQQHLATASSLAGL